MIASPALDVPVLTRLGAVDPVLAPLAAALFGGGGTPPAAWRLHDVQWTPGRSCRLAYFAPGRRDETTFVDVHVSVDGSSQQDYRADVALPGLRVATDRAAVARCLERVLGEPVIGCTVEPVRYRPGQRCVLRYEVRTPRRRFVSFAKVFRRDDFGAAASVVSALSRGPWAVGLLPRLVCEWPEADAVVVEAAAGRSASVVLWDATTGRTERDQAAVAIGAALADFHAHSQVPAPRWSALHQVAALKELLVTAEHADPVVAERLRALAGRLADATPPDGREVLGHGAFRTGQLLIRKSGRLTVLDVDGACRTSPAHDVGSILAHLVWLGLRRPQHRAAADNVGTSLLAAYEERAGRVDAAALAWWRAVALLQVGARRFRRLETQDWATVPALVEAAADLVDGAVSRPSVPARGGLLDVPHMSDVLNHALAARTTPPTDGVTVVSATELARAPGRRTVVRYHVRGLDGAAETLVVGKAFVEQHRAELLHRHLHLLDSLAPEPLAHVPHLGLVLYRHREGTPLDRVIDAAALSEGVRGAARWLAALHSASVLLPRALQVDVERATAHAWAGVLASAHPDLAGPALAIADRWPAGASDPVQRVPLHKDFHPGHVLVGDGVHVLDLDEARQGDPAFDLGHFRAYAELLRDGPSLAADFLEEYAAVTGWVDRGSLRSFEAYAWLKIARQWAAGAAPFRNADAALRRAGIEHALERGLACLPA